MSLSSEIIETIKGLSGDHEYSNLPVTIFHPIGSISKVQRRELDATIKKMIEQRPEFGVIGGYNRGNIWSKPENSYVVIKKNDIIININDRANRLAVMVDTSDPVVTKFGSRIFKSLSKAFIMVIGDNVEEIMQDIATDNQISNVEYQLEEFHPQEYADDIEIINLLDSRNELPEDRLSAIIERLWGYKSLKLMKTPHVAALSIDGDIMGGARVNELVKDTAVIGGVITLKEFRGRGVGTAVSSALIGIMYQQGYTIYLATDKGNKPARRIYEKLGFEQVGGSYFFDIGTNVIEEGIIGDRDY